MKFKPVVASLVVLGLMSPAFAHDVKSIAAQKAVVDQNSVINTVCSDGWFNRISLGGIGSIVGIVGSRDLPGSFTNIDSGSDFFVNNANLLAGVDLSKWSKVDLNLAYQGAPSPWYMNSSEITTVGRVASHRIFADEFYVTFSNFAAHYPVYLKVGKTYVPFGDYSDQYVPWQIESPAQMLAQTNGPAAILGVASDFGFYASIFALKGETAPVGSKSNNIRNWGGKIGYSGDLRHFEAQNTKFNVNVSYMRNIWDSLAFTPNTSSPQAVADLSDAKNKRDPVSAFGAHADVCYRALSLYADLVGTVKNMHSTYPEPGTFSNSSKFWGANVNAAYAFETMSHDSSLGAGLQFSGNGEWFADNNIGKISADEGGKFEYVIPKWRALAEYKVNLYKNTDLGLVYAHSKSYDKVGTGTDDRSSNVGFARLAVRF